MFVTIIKNIRGSQDLIDVETIQNKYDCTANIGSNKVGNFVIIKTEYPGMEIPSWNKMNDPCNIRGYL